MALNPLSSLEKRQRVVYISTIEVEYHCAMYTDTTTIWIQNLIWCTWFSSQHALSLSLAIYIYVQPKSKMIKLYTILLDL